MGTLLPTSEEVSEIDYQEGTSSSEQLDAGALFVLKSRGSWLHCGYHLTTSIVAPSLLSLPYALSLMGWFPGVLCLILAALVTFYSYNLLSLVLEHHAQLGKRQLRFRVMAEDILGPAWGRYFVGPIQFGVCYGSVISCILLGGQSLKFIYLLSIPKGEHSAVRICQYFWHPDASPGSDSIFPLPTAYQPCLSSPCPCLQRLHYGWLCSYRELQERASKKTTLSMELCRIESLEPSVLFRSLLQPTEMELFLKYRQL
ncbi:hypothetical protein OIU77_012855 [Salix suchowensis]|uniref:Amino acid transporter transmembrane domain-containing protein n=1 Tax=Salix suchowensis TaxID=1278906 RepID=A0ABQ9A5W4_9ROSI|nr:hypothetical protein OIU77_012855 [Salix suchowensis]